VNLSPVDEDDADVRLSARGMEHDDAHLVRLNVEPRTAAGTFVVVTDEPHLTRFR